MAESHTRQAARTPVTLKIKFKSSTLDQFIERYSVDVSHGGIFIRTKDPLPVGTQLRFEFQLKDASPLIRGEGTVVWTREHDPNRAGVAPGMGVRFDRLAEGSQEVLDKILAQKTAKGGPKGPSFQEQPTRVTSKEVLAGLSEKSAAPAPKIGTMAPKRDGFGGPEITNSDATPLPKPMPFHSDVDDFPDEAFEEATKVASLEALAAQSARDDGDEGPTLARPVAATAAQVRDELAERRAARTRPADEPAPAASAGPSAGEDEAARAAAARKADDDRRAEEARAAAARAKAEQEAKQEAAAQQSLRRSGSGAAAESAARTSSSRLAAARAATPPVDAPGAPKKSRTTTYLLVALLLVVAGGAAAYWYKTRGGGDEGNKVAQNQPPAPTPSPGPTAPQAPADPQKPVDPPPTPPAKPLELFSATVQAVPAEAAIELADGSQKGTGSVTFKDLDKAAPPKVRISAPGYVAQELPLDPAASKPLKVTLAEKAWVLHITSEPPGAKVAVRNRAVPGVTPLDVTLDAKQRRKDLTVKLTLAGFQPSVTTVDAATAGGFTDGDAAMVQEVAATLARQQVAARVKPPVDRPPRDKPPADKPPVDKPPVDKPPADKPPVDKPPAD
ncbi:MAG TPA: TIGR02266 family protein, partial [Kofleriaceae bacterium]|nr:TIGR02266 family protein [Kofleriaceae bacterium]